MTTTLYGFECQACQLIGWPFTESCPTCDGPIHNAEVANIDPAVIRGWRLRVPDEFMVLEVAAHE